ncbi:MAG: ABC transporter substrate-binding protein [Candidatus Rokubacteria bacterium]|nr:ABC transporter substrate-binding protein [Candidatus Rokubacteria bacterium]
MALALRLTRRELLVAGGLTVGAAALAAATSPARAQQQPKRGGTVTLRGVDPPHWDPMLTSSFKTQSALSFTHSRLMKHRAGPDVAPGTFPLEGDLAESWKRTGETTWEFKLRRGVRWQPKPPVNGRELTAEDVKYSVERFLTVPGNAYAYMLKLVERVEAPDKSTVRFTLKEPFAWFLDVLANPMAVAIVARECVEKFGDLKKPEACVGSGPWMLESYRPNQGSTFVRNPNYYVPNQPYIDRIEWIVDEDSASRMSSFLAGKYDIGYNDALIFRTEWNQLKDALKQKRPHLRVTEIIHNIVSHLYMRSDKPPFNDPRVRQAIALAIDRDEIMTATLDGTGAQNPPIPAGLKEWSLPVEKLGEGARYYKRNVAEAKRLLAAAGHPNGFPVSICFTTYGSSILVDQMTLILRHLKDVGIDAKLDQKEYGAYFSTCFQGKYESMAFGPQTPFLDPDNILYSLYMPGELRNHGHVNDPVATDLIARQRRTFDVAKRRELIYEVQRHLAKQQYYVTVGSSLSAAVWESSLKNYGPNFGYDAGGRLIAAWLDR